MALADFQQQKYISLETYRRDGTAVRTPVWFAAANARLYIYSIADTGKVKRIRRNPAAKIAPCDARGAVTGPWTDVVVKIVGPEEFNLGMRLLDQKYFPWKQLLKLGAIFSRRERVVLAISEPPPG